MADGAEIEGVPAVHNQQPLTQKGDQGTETEAAGSRSNDAATGSVEKEVIGSEAGASKLPDSHFTDGAEIEGVPAVHNQQPLTQKGDQGTATEAAGSRSNDAAAGSAETEVIGSEAGASKLPDSHLTDGAEIEGVPAVHNQQPPTQKGDQGTATEAAGSRSNDAAAGSAETEVIGSEADASKLPDSQLTDGAEIEGVPAVHNQQPLTQKGDQGTETEAAGSRSNDAAAGSAETVVTGSEADASKLPDSQLTDGTEMEGVPAVHNQQPLTQKGDQGTETEAAGSRSNDAAAGSAETVVTGSEADASKLPDSQLTDGTEMEGVPAVHNQQPLTQKGDQGTETEAAGSRSNDAAAAGTEVVDEAANVTEIEGLAANSQQPLADAGEEGEETAAAGFNDDKLVDGSGELVEKAVNEDASAPEVQAEGTEFVAQGIPLSGENDEFLEGTLLEALQDQNEAPKAPDAEAENIEETSETPKFRWGWWRLSRVAPEPEFEVRHVVHYKDGVQLGPSRLERRPRSGYAASKASKGVEIARPGDGEAQACNQKQFIILL